MGSGSTPGGSEVARKIVDSDGTDAHNISPFLISGVSTREGDPSPKYDVRIRAVDAAGNEDTAVSALRFTRTFDSKSGRQRGVAAD